MKRSRHLLRSALAILLSVSLVAASAAPALAVGLIRDTEIERTVTDYARPILRAAGIPHIRIRLVGELSVNAFVVDANNIFMHAGTLMRAERPNEVIGIIAHEAGHIVGGHLSRLRQARAQAHVATLALRVLMLAATAAGAATGSASLGSAGAGALIGLEESGRRLVLDYQRSEEASADQIALSLLNDTGQSARGMLDTFLTLADQQSAFISNANPYLLSHPLPRERYTILKDMAQKSPHFDKRDPASLQKRHDMMRAKLSGFLEEPRTVFNRYPQSDQSMPAQYARAIATYRGSGVEKFITKIDALIKQEPDNPYFYEIKGQFLNNSSKPKSAVPPLRRAVELAPDAALIRVLLAQALLAHNQNRGTSDAGQVNEAIGHLRTAVRTEKCYSQAYRRLGQAYYMMGQTAQAQLASATAYQYEGDLEGAKRQAQQALKALPPGTPEWRRASDIVNSDSKGCPH